jgi:hypothetical protein
MKRSEPTESELAWFTAVYGLWVAAEAMLRTATTTPLPGRVTWPLVVASSSIMRLTKQLRDSLYAT